MGPYVAGNTMLVGFFAFAALHYFYLWWYSRKERVLLTFSLFCVAQAATSTQIVAMATAKTIESFQTAFDRHLTFGLLCLMASIWVLSLATKLTARWFVIPATFWMIFLIALNLSALRPIGFVTDIAQFDLPWGEQVTSFRRNSAASWYEISAFLSLLATKVFGFVAASILWRKDRLGGVLIALGTLSTLNVVVVAYFFDWGELSLPFFGAGPNAIFVLFISVQLSRQYAQRSEQLDASQRRFRAIFDQTFQFIGLMKTDGTILEVNRTALEFAAISEQEVLGKLYWDTPWWTHSPELQQQLRDGVQKAAGGDLVRFESTHQKNDGQIHTFDFSLKPVLDHAGNVALLIPEGRDITQFKNVEDTIRHILVSISPTVGQSFFLTLANHLSRACQVNYAFVGVLDPLDINFVRSIAASHCGETVENFSYCLTDTPCSNVVCQEFCYHPTGIQRDFPKDELLARMGIDSYMGIPLKSSTGQSLGLIVLLHDRPMTQPEQSETILRVVAARAAAELERELSEVRRQEVERTLKERETFIRLAQEAAKVGSWEWDVFSDRFKWSDELARMLGISTAEFDGTWEMIQSFCHPEDLQMLQGTMEEAIAGKELRSVECRIVRRDATERVLWLLGHPQRNEQGVITKVLGVAIDITERKRIETELHESNRFNMQILANMPNGLIVMDHDLRYQVWNNRMEEMSGLSAPEVLGKRPLDVFPFLQSTGVLDLVSRALAGETLTSVDFPFNVPKSGRKGWCMQVMGPLRNSRNEIVGVLVNVIDITDRKDAESQLLEAIRSKEEIVALLDTLQTAAPIGLAFVDRNLRYVRCNDALAEIRGVSTEDHVGRFVSEVVPDLWPQIEPLYQQILSGQELVINREITGETPAKPGEIRSWQVSYYPVKNHQDIIGVGVIVNEDTERKRAEEALRTSEERFRLLFEGASDAIFWADASTGILTHCNHSAEVLLGRERAEIIGQPQSFLHPPEDANKYREVFQAYAKTERKTNLEAEVQRKDGRKVIVSVAPSVTTIGRQRVIQGIFRDISERKRVDEELRASRQRLEFLSRQLIATQESERRHLARELHDEIGQVLTAIKINLRRTQRVADASLQSNLNDVVEIVDQAIGQVRNLALRLRPAQLDELGLVAALHWLLKNQAELGGIKEEFEVGSGNFDVPSEMKTVCFRITQEALTNAIRHATPTKVQVKLWTADNKLFLTIHDDGIGFDVTESRRRALRGESFGLVSIQERASLAGGYAEIESQPGQGTNIQVWFPLPHE